MKLTTTIILLLMVLEWRKIALSDIRHALKGNDRVHHLALAKQSAAHFRSLLSAWSHVCGMAA
jgi:hypothetical protein